MSEPTISLLQSRTIDAREAAYEDAIRAVAKYKFWMFGYHAASWVKYNRLLVGTPWHQGSPFKRFVELGRIEVGELPDAKPHERHEARKLSGQWGEDMFDIDADIDAEMVSGEVFHPLPRVGDEPNATGVVTPDESEAGGAEHLSSHFQQRVDWERFVHVELITSLEISNGDAQGIVEAQGDLITGLYMAGYTPVQAAQAIDKASRGAA